MKNVNIKCSVKFGALAIILMIFISTVADAAIYYVRTDGNNSNSGLANNSVGAWRTIDYAADHVSAGDVVRVQAGTYAETVTPGVNGTYGNTITFVADGSVTVGMWLFNGQSYIRVIGFKVDPTVLVSNTFNVEFKGTNTGLEFWNNTLQNCRRDAFRITGGTINNSLIIGNTIGPQLTGRSSAADYGNGICVYGDSNLVAYNTIIEWDYLGIVVRGNDNRILNNYIYGLQQINGRHPDFIYMGNSPTQRNVIEAMLALGTPTAPDNKWFWMENYGTGTTTNNIIRRNIGHNIGSGGIGHGNNSTTYRVDYTRIYNNTAVDLTRYSSGVPYGFAVLMGAGATNCYVFNNLAYEAWSSNVVTGIQVFYFQNATTCDYNLAYETTPRATYGSPWTAQSHRWTANPYFTDYANDDFTIGSRSSAAVGNGGPLTRVSGNGTGVTFNVLKNGGGFFVGDNPNLSQYGGNLVAGDLITVGNKTVRISSISGDSITVTAPFTWANGEPVYYGDSGSPDIGAYPFKADGYNLTASYSRSSGIVTVTPSDASLVRFVICYEDGIPTGVANSSPYTCSVGSGAVNVRVYPLYANKTLYVGATRVAAVSAPSNLTIVDR